uniref:Teneurin N-terminal domain-containing protein n=1 Tax=Molossus molossus TaxID=27622 RepID=A0A7J8I9I8_MOLMO|nr:hypothetical protein HJG59_010520 [Molossus molossus]
MDVKDRRHRSLTRGRCGKECRYTSSSLDSEDCRVPTQKSYSSSETLKAYDHDSRMHYGNRVTDLVHRESDEFPRQGPSQNCYSSLALCFHLMSTQVGRWLAPTSARTVWSQRCAHRQHPGPGAASRSWPTSASPRATSTHLCDCVGEKTNSCFSVDPFDVLQRVVSFLLLRCPFLQNSSD